MTSGPGIGARAPETIAALQGKNRDRPRRFGSGRIVSWIVFILAMIYFFVPLIATLEFSLRAKPAGAAYSNTFKDPEFFSSLLYSFVIGLITIVVSTLIIVPTAYWVRLKLPRLRPFVEFVTLMPFVIPPVILVFGLIRSYSGAPFHLTETKTGGDILLIAAYTVLSFPYMYRAVDTGLRSIDVRALTEAGQSLGSGTLRILWSVIFPNLRVSLISGAFLTLAIVIGEFTIAVYLARPAFGPYLQHLGQNASYEPAAVSLISFGLTWAAMGVIALLGRSPQGRRTRIQVGGAH
ncbi:MAG: putative spermidine/putrescine transport system permease protein [Chloroflexota bacterium]|jgi:putative spermidine/putrescine transport system permease protein|nr:putative spermidine/putrescine transport system permease protein [Chloroflexota bacterium]